jgi:hypothetical protein
MPSLSSASAAPNVPMAGLDLAPAQAHADSSPQASGQGCEICAAFEHPREVITWRDRQHRSAASAPRFGALREGTRFSMFTCEHCETVWAWSLAEGWHHAGERHPRARVLPSQLLEVRLPRHIAA